MNSYLKGAPCLVKGLIILFLNYCVSTIKFSRALLHRSELTFALSCLQVAAPSLISRAWLA